MTSPASLEGCVSSQAAIILRLQSELNDTEQYSRSSNLEIHDLPATPDENLGVFLSDLSQKLEIPSFSPNQVSAIHRLPKRKSGPATVLVRFTSKEVRDRCLAARSKLRDLTNSSDQTPLYFSENLTKSNRELFFASRAVAKEHNIQFVWAKNGRIYLRKEEGEPAIRLHQLSDLERLNQSARFLHRFALSWHLTRLGSEILIHFKTRFFQPRTAVSLSFM